MSMIVRHALSILLLPVTVVVIVPFLLLRTGGAPAGRDLRRGFARMRPWRG
jgi:hypothetical protein